MQYVTIFDVTRDGFAAWWFSAAGAGLSPSTAGRAPKQYVSRMTRLRDIDRVVIELQRAYPAIVCEQLRVAHPGADDDGIWFFTHPEGCGEVQLESSSGELPFLVEGTDSASVDHARTIEHATSLVAARLGLPRRARE